MYDENIGLQTYFSSVIKRTDHDKPENPPTYHVRINATNIEMQCIDRKHALKLHNTISKCIGINLG